MISTQIADVEESSRKEATAQQKRLHELEAALEKSGAPQDALLVGAVKNKSYEAPNLENNQVRVPRKAGESKHDYLVRKFGVMQDDRVAFKAAKAAKLASMNSEIASLNHQAYDARAADLNAERTKAGVVAAKAKRVHIQDPKTKKWKRKSSCEKADAPDVTEDVGVEEEKGGEPAPPSPPPRALQDHNDNEETKDEAKAKVKKPPAKKGYVKARVRKLEGKE